MIIDFLTYNLKKKLAHEVERAESAETALKIDSFAGANWNASGKTIDFYNGYGDMIDSIDASDFIIDGMIENVTLSGTVLTITFNTDAGKQDIVIDLSTIIDTDLADRVDEIEEVTAIALNELHDDVLELSGNSANYITSADTVNFITSADTANFVTSGDFQTALDSKQDVLSAGTNVTITDNVISVNIDTSNFVLTNDLRTLEEVLSTAINNLNSRLTALENA